MLDNQLLSHTVLVMHTVLVRYKYQTDCAPATLQDPNDCFAFDLEYAKASGLNNLDGAAPVLQMAFQYSILLPQPPSQADAAAPSPQQK